MELDSEKTVELMVNIYWMKEAIDNLRENPLRGRVGKLHRTRELILPDNPLKAIYTVEEQLITILFIPHQRQRWPKT